MKRIVGIELTFTKQKGFVGDFYDPKHDVRHTTMKGRAQSVPVVEKQMEKMMREPFSTAGFMRTGSVSYWLGVLLCLAPAIPAGGEVLFSEDYEVATINDLGAKKRDLFNPTGSSSIVVGPIHPSATEGRRGGSKVLRQVYDEKENCNPCIGNSFVGFSFAPQKEIYARYYYLTEPIPPATASSYHKITSKQHYLYSGGAHPSMYPSGGTNHLWGSREIMTMMGQYTADRPGGDNAYPNQAHVELKDNRWYCIEYHFKMNTPDSYDGLHEIWVDGILTSRYTGRKFLDATHADGKWNYIKVYRQGANNMYRYEDDFVVATTRIGGKGITIDTVPAAPTNLTAKATSGCQIALAWKDNAGNETGFEIEQKTAPKGAWAKIAAVPANQTSYRIATGLVANQPFYFRVRALNPYAGPSDYSQEVMATISTKTVGKPATTESKEKP